MLDTAIHTFNQICMLMVMMSLTKHADVVQGTILVVIVHSARVCVVCVFVGGGGRCAWAGGVCVCVCVCVCGGGGGGGSSPTHH